MDCVHYFKLSNSHSSDVLSPYQSSTWQKAVFQNMYNCLCWQPETPAGPHCWLSQECCLIAVEKPIKLQEYTNHIDHAARSDDMIPAPTLRNISSWLLRASTRSLSVLPNGRSGNIFFGPLTSKMQSIDFQWDIWLDRLKFDVHLKQRIISYSWLIS